jgi:hypothetical protein
MADPAPIVEMNSGQREFLLSSQHPYRAPYVASRVEPFPDAASLEKILDVRRHEEHWMEQYGTGRVANNLAAVYMCTGDLPAALEAIQEAEQKFLAMLNENNPYPRPLTFGGLAMVQYNAAVLFRMPGAVEGNFGKSDDCRRIALETLDYAVEEEGGTIAREDEDNAFVRAAIDALAFPDGAWKQTRSEGDLRRGVPRPDDR